jgi:hypothetical protein
VEEREGCYGTIVCAHVLREMSVSIGCAGGPDYKEEAIEEDAKKVMVTEGQQTYLVVVGNGGGGDGLHDLREHERGGDRGRFVFFSRSCYSPLWGSFFFVFFFFFLSRTTRARNRDVDSGGSVCVDGPVCIASRDSSSKDTDTAAVYC